MFPPPVRSALYIPANKERAIDKARTLACDRVMLDLEDAVAPEIKAEARDQAITAIATGGFASGAPILRINGLDTPWGNDDLKAAAQSGASAVLVPKLSSTETLEQVRAVLPESIKIWAMIETCAAILNINAIASTGKKLGLEGFVIGTNDLAKEMRCRPGASRAPLLTALSLSVMAARAYDIIALDGVYNDFRDLDGLRAECAQGVELGYDGKSLIHPDQIPITNEMFSPSAEEIEQARAIVAAFALPENAGKGVISANGKMVELLHLSQAHRILAIADLINA